MSLAIWRFSPSARTSAAPGRSRATRPRSSPPARSTATSRAASSARRSSATVRSSPAARWPRAATTARFDSRARNTSCRTATSSTFGLPPEDWVIGYQMRNVLVCEAQVPFVHGGAELHVRGLVAELTRRGYRAERVSVPFKWYPKDELLTHAAAWRMIDLSESNGERIDTVIATKFPTYFVRHPNKVTWLFHQYRAIYDLCGTPYSEFDHTEGDVALRARLIALDNDVLRESARLFANARNTAARLARYNGLTAEPLYHPPPLAGPLTAGPAGDYVLSVGRLEAIKRVGPIIAALAHVDPPSRPLPPPP